VLIAIVMLFICMLLPLGSIIRSTFLVVKTDARTIGQSAGSFTLYYWKYVLASVMSSAVLYTPLIHSLIVTFFTTLICVPIGSLLAWLMIRSNLPGRKVISFLIVIPYMIPVWCKSFAWLSIFRTTTAGAPGLLAGIGIITPDWLAYGPVAIVIIMSLHYYSYSYIMVSAALRSVNSELEEMGEIQGAKKMQIIRKITLPLVMPAVLSSVIMTLSKCLGGYGVANSLGTPVNYYLLSTRLYDLINSGTMKPSGYVISILLVLMASGTLVANHMMLGTRKSYASISGKGTRSNDISLGSAKTPLMLFIIVFLIVTTVLPFGALIMESFQKAVGAGYQWSNLTLYNWIGTIDQATGSQVEPGLFHDPQFLTALWNTIRISVISSIVCAFFGQFFGYISSRGRGKWFGTLVEQFVFIPHLMPAMAFSVAMLTMFSVRRGFIPSLYGTFTLVLLVSIVKQLPFASRTGTANMLQIHAELEEAADIQGAGFFTRMARIIFPLAKNGFFSGLMLVLITIAKELDLIILIATSKTRTLSMLSYSYKSGAVIQQSDACTIVLIVFVMLAYWIANKFFNADISKTWG
jgi:iron(III) transport system permease protein